MRKITKILIGISAISMALAISSAIYRKDVEDNEKNTKQIKS